MLPKLRVFGLVFHSFNLFWSLGVASLAVLCYRRAAREGIDLDRMLTLLIVVILSAMAGCRVFYVWEAWPYFREHPLETLMIWRGGLAFFGGLTFGAASVVLYAFFAGLPVGRVCDVFSLNLPLAHAFGRAACLYHGCCFGKVTDLPWGVVFARTAHDTAARHPTQAYELLGLLLLYLVLARVADRTPRFPAGTVSGLYFLGYGVMRFGLEYLRDDSVGPQFLGLFRYQWVSVAAMTVGLVFLACARLSTRQPVLDQAS